MKIDRSLYEAARIVDTHSMTSLVPTLCVGTDNGRSASRLLSLLNGGELSGGLTMTQSVYQNVPTQSVGSSVTLRLSATFGVIRLLSRYAVAHSIFEPGDVRNDSIDNHIRCSGRADGRFQCAGLFGTRLSLRA